MSIDNTLSLIEAQLQDMQAALLSSDPQALEQTAAQLRQVATSLAQAAGAGLPAAAGLHDADHALRGCPLDHVPWLR